MGTTGSDRNEPILANLTRRQYLKTAAVAGAAVAVPTIIPASALGRGEPRAERTHQARWYRHRQPRRV